MSDSDQHRPRSSPAEFRAGVVSDPAAGAARLGYLPSPELDRTFPPFLELEKTLGSVPTLFRAQTLLPRAIEAEARIAETVLFTQKALSRMLKECLIVAVAAAAGNRYCVTAHGRFLEELGANEELIHQVATDFSRARLPAGDIELLRFGLKLSRHPTWIGKQDVDRLREAGFEDEAILEAVLVTALSHFLCTLSTGLGVEPDAEPRTSFPTDDTLAAFTNQVAPKGNPGEELRSPYLRAAPRDPSTFAPFGFFLDRFGFVPNVFRAQTLREDVLEAEAFTVQNVLLPEDLLSRKAKESILLVVSAANLNTYCVAVHCELLRALGVPVESSDQVAVDHHQAGLSPAECALLDVTLELVTRPSAFGKPCIDRLLCHGYTGPQALEAVVMTALASFLNTVQMGLAPHPDFTPRLRFQTAKNPGGLDNHEVPASFPKPANALAHRTDSDAPLVRKAQDGDLGAFEQLVHRHAPRVQRTIASILGSYGDAEDGVQETFVKVYRHLDRFEGASRFSSWIMRIAVNEALQLVRRRRPTASLDEVEDERIRPRNVRAWAEAPETLFERKQARILVRTALEELPVVYRVVLTLQQLEGLPVAEVAETLGISVGAVKTRAHRGRMMLREKLARHFAASGGQSS